MNQFILGILLGFGIGFPLGVFVTVAKMRRIIHRVAAQLDNREQVVEVGLTVREDESGISSVSLAVPPELERRGKR